MFIPIGEYISFQPKEVGNRYQKKIGTLFLTALLRNTVTETIDIIEFVPDVAIDTPSQRRSMILSAVLGIVIADQ